MLFNYRYVTHSIERFQDYLDHLVKEVWCKAAGNFTVDLLHADLRDIVLDIYNPEDDTPRGGVTTNWLHGPIDEIFNLFKNLDPGQRQQISDWYDHNNDIEALCSGDPAKTPATYGEIAAINADLAAALKKFCLNLFKNVIGLSAVTSRIGSIKEHYAVFVTENRGNKCPYCGYGSILGVDNTHRDAYDHFLPESVYPFNSVNFHNLAPMCHECNSSYKSTKDPIRCRLGAARRKAFYSYAAVASGITVTVNLNTNDVTNLKSSEIDLQVTAPGRQEEVEGWKEVFGIEERYKAKLCGENDGRAWVQQVIEEGANVDLTPAQVLAYEIRAAERRPYADANFLKKPFLIACQNAGII